VEIVGSTQVGFLAKIAGTAFVVAAGIAFALLAMVDYIFPLRGTMAIALALMVIAIFIWGKQVKSRLPRVGKNSDGEAAILRAANPLPNLVAARTVALAFAASRSGAVLAGGYFGIALATTIEWQVVAARETILVAAISGILAVGLGWIGIWLERICTLPNLGP
jgi:hypothetical protein